jgi:hypothetical protein
MEVTMSKSAAVARTGRIAGALTGLVFGASALWPALAVEATAPPNFSPDSIVGWIAVPGGFKPPASGPGPIVNDPAHPQIVNLLPNYPPSGRIQGGQPTFPVADLTNPILQPWAREELRKRNERILSGKTGYSRQASCWPIGVPGFLLHGVQPVYFIQTAKEVVMVWQEDYQTRRVYLNVPHSAKPAPSWFGESIGHYEGDTLVVDTIGMNDQTWIDNFRTPHTDRLHVVERFHVIDGGKTLEVNVHVEDPGAFATPWNTIQRYGRVQFGPLIEVSCAEGSTNNYLKQDMEPIPQAAKPDF